MTLFQFKVWLCKYISWKGIHHVQMSNHISHRLCKAISYDLQKMKQSVSQESKVYF